MIRHTLSNMNQQSTDPMDSIRGALRMLPQSMLYHLAVSYGRRVAPTGDAHTLYHGLERETLLNIVAKHYVSDRTEKREEIGS